MKFRIKLISFWVTLIMMLSLPFLVQSKVDTYTPIEISSPPIDSYADEIVEGLSYILLNGQNALGAPDAVYAQIFQGYTNGLLTLDMGRYEKIVNGTGDDFTVHCLSGGYTIKAGSNIQQPLTTIGQGENTTSFDLSSVGLEEARYVQVQYRTGVNVFLDAIETIHQEVSPSESIDPIITPVDDFEVWDNISAVEFTWEVIEENPWNYSISINDEIITENEWFDAEIDFSYTINGPEILEITLVVYDFFGSSSSDTVVVEIKAADGVSALSLVFSLVVLFGVTFMLKRKK